MLDIKAIRHDAEAIKASQLKRSGDSSDIDLLLQADEDHRACQVKLDQLRQERNTTSKQIGALKKAGEDASEIMAQVRELGDEIKSVETKMQASEDARALVLMGTPNCLHPSVPEGKTEDDNILISTSGELPKFDFEPKAHDELGVDLGLMDFERAAKLAGSRFVVMTGWGARLERALSNFMLDWNAQRGYVEVAPPLIVNRDTMTANGNLPKFEDDLFALNYKDYFLVPTAEVPLTNFHRNEILAKEDLPKNLTAHTACFRAEAGAAGRDTRGLIRLHQFAKVELVKVVEPETSFEELDKMVADASSLLSALELPHRVMALCAGDTGFNASKTFDIEVWFPSQDKYREVSSCSNCTDFQARRGKLRYRPEPNASTVYPHTLNGSALPIGRTLAALLENHQQADGTIKIPNVLQPYLGGATTIS